MGQGQLLAIQLIYNNMNMGLSLKSGLISFIQQKTAGHHHSGRQLRCSDTL